MSGFESETCSHCPAVVVWAVLKNLKSIPVDIEPVEGGSIALSIGPNGHAVARVLTVAQQFGRTKSLRRSHFDTCPKAALLRKATR